MAGTAELLTGAGPVPNAHPDGAARPSLTQRRAEELRLSIARAAMQIFVTDGDTSATVERIAEAAGVAPRTFYRHFAVKEDVVLPLFRRSSARIAAQVRTADRALDVVGALVSAFSGALNEARVSAAQKAFLGLMMTSPEYRTRWLTVDDELRDAVAGLLADRLGLDADPFAHELATHLLVNTARQVFELWLTSSSADSIEGLLRRGFGMVLTGVQAHEIL